MRPTDFDEQFVHQTPDLLPFVETRNPHWRESLFFDIHSPDGDGDVVFFTMAHFPARRHMDSIQMGRVDGERILGVLDRPTDHDHHVLDVGGASVTVVQPWREVKLWADPSTTPIGLDVTFTARTQPYGLRRGTMRTADAVVWDQSHILQSGVYTGTYTVGGVTRSVDGWIGQRDHSWGVREHSRCPLWLWLQIQLDDGMLCVWHWEYENGARVYSDGCWAGTDMSDPVPVIDLRHDLRWLDAHGAPTAYGEHGDTVELLEGTCVFTLEGGRTITVEATGRFDRPYEPYHRGGLSQMKVRCTDDDGRVRTGTAIYEVTGARHHHFFPGTTLPGDLPR